MNEKAGIMMQSLLFRKRKQHADDWFIGKRSHGTDKKKQGESTDEEMPILDLLNHIDMEKLSRKH